MDSIGAFAELSSHVVSDQLCLCSDFDLHLGVCISKSHLQNIKHLFIHWTDGHAGKIKWSTYILEYRKPWWILKS